MTDLEYDNDAFMEGDYGLEVAQRRIDFQVLGYHDFHDGAAAMMPANDDYMIGYQGAAEGLVI